MNITIPLKHLVISQKDATSKEVIETLLLDFEPNLPERFASVMTIHVSDSTAPITGIFADSSVKDVAGRIFTLFNKDFVDIVTDGVVQVLSVLLWYNEERKALVGNIGVLTNTTTVELPEGTFTTPQRGKA